MSSTLSHIKPIAQQNELSQLILDAARSDRRAQAELYKKFFGKYMSVCLRYLEGRDDALEALNHGFLKIFNNLAKYDRAQSFEGWGYRIVQNTAIDYARKKIKRSDFVNISEQEMEVSIDPKYTENVLPDEWINLLKCLPIATRTVFNLVALENYKHQEIAKLLSISEGTSKWHMNHARKLLKDKLEQKI